MEANTLGSPVREIKIKAEKTILLQNGTTGVQLRFSMLPAGVFNDC